jgi:uracil-DNA glycosylase family 4
VSWREEAARVKRAAYLADEYWGRPLPGFGDPRARVLVLGLAPAAHGGNRTGRIFTGDRSGDWLFAALWRSGFANQPTSVTREDGLKLHDCYVTAAVRCPPPSNRPHPVERDNCMPYLLRELSLLSRVRAIVCLGGFAWDVAFRAMRVLGVEVPRPRPRFAHGATHASDKFTLLGCYHPSQQNTFTGKLTEGMMEEVFERAREVASVRDPSSLR